MAAYPFKNNVYYHFMLALRIFYDKNHWGNGIGFNGGYLIPWVACLLSISNIRL
jgi:hypothetical protein